MSKTKLEKMKYVDKITNVVYTKMKCPKCGEKSFISAEQNRCPSCHTEIMDKVTGKKIKLAQMPEQ